LKVCLTKDPKLGPLPQELLSHSFLTNSKQLKLLIPEILDLCFDIHEEELASHQIWSVEVRLENFILKTHVHPSLNGIEIIKKIAKKLPNPKSEEYYNLYIEPEGICLDPHVKLYHYRKYRIKNEIKLVLKEKELTLPKE